MYPVQNERNEWFWDGLPYAVLLVVSFVGGFAADRCVKARWHPTVVRQIFQLGGTLIPTLFLVVLAFAYFDSAPVTALTITATGILACVKRGASAGQSGD